MTGVDYIIEPISFHSIDTGKQNFASLNGHRTHSCLSDFTGFITAMSHPEKTIQLR